MTRMRKIALSAALGLTTTACFEDDADVDFRGSTDDGPRSQP